MKLENTTGFASTSKASDDSDTGSRHNFPSLSSSPISYHIDVLYVLVILQDSDVEDVYVSENNLRRLNWQKGRQDWARPSKIAAEIEKVTVDTMPEVFARMRMHGWAILRDSTNIYHPKARFTREQMTYIDKCKI